MTKMWSQCSEKSCSIDNVTSFKQSIKSDIIQRRRKSEVSSDQAIINEVLEYVRLLYT